MQGLFKEEGRVASWVAPRETECKVHLRREGRFFPAGWAGQKTGKRGKTGKHIEQTRKQQEQQENQENLFPRAARFQGVPVFSVIFF